MLPDHLAGLLFIIRMKAQVNNPGKAARSSINGENNVLLRRSNRGRDVSSRYLYPTGSPATPASPLNNNNNNKMSDCVSSPPPLRRSNSPNTNSHRKLKNGGILRSASAERWRPAEMSKSKIDSAKANSNGNGARPPMQGLWPNSCSSTWNGMSAAGDQLGIERLKRIGELRSSDPSFKVAGDRGSSRTSPVDPRRRYSQENTKPSSNGEYENTNSFDDRIGFTSSGRSKLQTQGSSSAKSSESSNKGSKAAISRGASSPRLEPRASKSAGHTDRLQSVAPARLSVDSLEIKKPGGGDTATSEDRSLGSFFVTPKPGASKGNNNNNNTIRKANYVPARFLHDTLRRIRRLSDANLKQQSTLRKSSSSSSGPPEVAASLSSNSSDGGNSSWSSSPDRFPAPTVAVPVPVRAPACALGKPCHIPRGLQAVSTRAKPGVAPSANPAGRPNCGMQVFKDKKAISGQEESAHRLRLLHNRWLQWRFVNARAQAAHQAQIISAQEVLYNACAKTSELRISVAAKRIELQKARHKLKLTAVLAAHAVQLEDWVTLEKEHASAITGAMECLDAAIVRIPLVAGAKADALSVKQALSFAADVMNAMEGAAAGLFSQADKVGYLLPELAETVCQERAFLEECVEMVAAVASLEDEERYLRICLIQLQQSKSQQQKNDGVCDSALSSNAERG